MEVIKPIIKDDKKKVKTMDVQEVSYYVLENSPTMILEDAEDYNSSQYLVSDNGKFIAKYNRVVGAVGFYREVGEDVKHLSHVTPKEIAGVVWTIEKSKNINLFTKELPQGDILVKFSDEDVVTLDNESIVDMMGYVGYDDLVTIDKIYYTGISRGKTQIKEIDLSTLGEYIEPIETECGINCDCIDYCAETGESF